MSLNQFKLFLRRWIAFCDKILVFNKKLSLILLFGLILAILSLTNNVFALSTLENDFDDYNLGDFRGQDADWIVQASSTIFIADNVYQSGGKSLYFEPDVGTRYLYAHLDSEQEQGTFKFYSMFNSSSTTGGGYQTIILSDDDGDKCAYLVVGFEDYEETFYSYYDRDNNLISLGIFEGIPTLWKKLEVQWDTSVSTSTRAMRYRFDSTSWNNWEDVLEWDCDGVSYITITDGQAGQSDDFGIYYDSFSQYGITPLRVWASEPESGTEITNFMTDFTFNWTGLDSSIYSDMSLLVSFKNTLGIHSKSLKFNNLSYSGSTTTKLTNFEIDRNGDWYFHAVSWEWHYEIIEGLYLTPTGYIEEITDDLTDGTYYLDVNVEALEELFVMPNFEDWYDEKTDGATPTQLFISIASFLQPIFEPIGEFGTKISSFLNLAYSYTQGNNLGAKIPLVVNYITVIEFLFGGFPIIKIFIVFLLIFSGMFIFKFLMRFIPFLG